MNPMLQQTPEWLEMRRKMIGASDAPVIMGVSPWKTQYQLWEEKVGVQTKTYMNSSMQRGLDLENDARMCFTRMTGIEVEPEVIFHQDISWMMASLDGIDKSHKNIVEIKCAGKEDHESALDGVVPAKYVPQLQHQMEVAGLDSAYYFSYDGEHGAVVQLGKDKRYVKKMIEHEQEFFKCVKDFVAPPLTKRDHILKNDQEWNLIATQWADIQDQVLELEKKEKQLRDKLVQMSEGNSCMGSGVKTSRCFRKGNVDYGQIPQLKGVSLEKYRKEPVEYWKISKS